MLLLINTLYNPFIIFINLLSAVGSDTLIVVVVCEHIFLHTVYNGERSHTLNHITPLHPHMEYMICLYKASVHRRRSRRRRRSKARLLANFYWHTIHTLLSGQIDSQSFGLPVSVVFCFWYKRISHQPAFS